MSCRKCRERKKLFKPSGSQKQPVYLDYNATTPVDRRVLRAYEETCLRHWGNASSSHRLGVDALETEERAEQTILKALGCPDNELIFTGSGSSAMNRLIQILESESSNCHYFFRRSEHISLHNALKNIEDSRKEILPEKPEKGEWQKLTDKCSGTPVILYSPVNHETGEFTDPSEIHCRGLTIIDGVQALPRLEPEQWVPYCSAFTFSGHKIGCPKGMAALCTGPGLKPAAEDECEAPGTGTSPTPAVSALAEAVSILNSEERRRMRILTAEAWTILKQGSFEILRNTPENDNYGCLNFSLPSCKNMTALLQYLNEEGYCVSRFSACTGETEGISEVLTAKGIEEERAARSLRVSLGRESTRAHISGLTKALGRYFR